MPPNAYPERRWLVSQDDDGFELRPGTDKSGPNQQSYATPLHENWASEDAACDHGKDGGVNTWRSSKSAIWWAPEVLWLLFGYLCFAGVAVLLVTYDGDEPPSLSLGITLNTLVALLVTLARIAFTAPIVEGFGQLKWTHFLDRSPRPLADFEALDQASRGPWGSFIILVKYKGFLATLGAVITISGLLTSTVTQQAIEYPLRRAPSDNGTASVGIATEFSMSNGTDLHLANSETTQLKQAIFNGAYAVSRSTLPTIAPTCSSADCEWPLYGSLAICSEVVNLTSGANETLLTHLRGQTAVSLGMLMNSTMSLLDHLQQMNNASLAAYGEIFPLTVLSLDAPTGALDESLLDLLAVDHFIAYTDQPFDVTKPLPPNLLDYFKFLEVAFYWCTKSYNTKVSDGIHTTEEVSSAARIVQSAPHQLGLNFAWSPTWYECYTKNTCGSTIGGLKTRIAGPPGLPPPLEGEGEDEGYDIDIWTATASSALLGASLYDSIFLDQQRGLVSSAGGGTAAAFASALYGEFLATRLPPPGEQFAAVGNITTNMATSLTNFLRSLAYKGEPAPRVKLGTTYTPQTYVRIRWGWITLLAAQLFLTSLFLIAIVVETHVARVQVLKDSTLATMCALDGPTREHLGGLGEFRAVRERARVLDVRVERGSSGTAAWLTAGYRSVGAS